MGVVSIGLAVFLVQEWAEMPPGSMRSAGFLMTWRMTTSQMALLASPASRQIWAGGTGDDPAFAAFRPFMIEMNFTGCSDRADRGAVAGSG